MTKRMGQFAKAFPDEQIVAPLVRRLYGLEAGSFIESEAAPTKSLSSAETTAIAAETSMKKRGQRSRTLPSGKTRGGYK